MTAQHGNRYGNKGQRDPGALAAKTYQSTSGSTKTQTAMNTTESTMPQQLLLPPTLLLAPRSQISPCVSIYSSTPLCSLPQPDPVSTGIDLVLPHVAGPPMAGSVVHRSRCSATTRRLLLSEAEAASPLLFIVVEAASHQLFCWCPFAIHFYSCLSSIMA